MIISLINHQTPLFMHLIMRKQRLFFNLREQRFLFDV